MMKPVMVAKPMSLRSRANREYTLAPSMPRNTNTVTSIVALTCSNTPVVRSPPYRL